MVDNCCTATLNWYAWGSFSSELNELGSHVKIVKTPRGQQPAAEDSTFRQVLAALQKKDPNRLGPPPLGREAGFDWEPRRRRTGAVHYAAAVLVLMLAATGAFLVLRGADQEHDPSGDSVTRLDQMSAAVRAPLQIHEEEMRPQAPQAAEEQSSAPERLATLIADDSTVEVQSGQRVLLPVHIENADVLEPETSVLVRELPGDIRLSEGIMIGPGIWMVRAGLLGSVEVDAGTAAPGRHTLLVELRMPEGRIVSTAQLDLAIAAAEVAPREEVPQAIAEDPPLELLSPPKRAAAPDRPPKRAAAPDNVKLKAAVAAPARKTVKKGKPAAQVQASIKPEPPKAPRRPKRRGDVAVMAVPPALAAPGQAPKLVWPGDDPREAYPANPPVFLGGAVPGSAQSGKAGPSAAVPNWANRVFDNTR